MREYNTAVYSQSLPRNRVTAEGAALAVAAHPHLVELVHRLLHEGGVVGVYFSVNQVAKSQTQIPWKSYRGSRVRAIIHFG